VFRIGRKGVELSSHRLAGSEVDGGSSPDLHCLTGPRVASGAGFLMPDLERAKAAQFDTVAIHQSSADAIKDGVDDCIDILGVEVRVLLRDAGNKLGSDHGSSMPSHSLDRNRAMAFPMTGRVAYRRAGHIGCSLAP